MEYLPIDFDNHYYESEDAFTRHGDAGGQEVCPVALGGKAPPNCVWEQHLDESAERNVQSDCQTRLLSSASPRTRIGQW